MAATLRVEMWENSYSIDNNTSNVSVEVWIDTGYSWNYENPGGWINWSGNWGGGTTNFNHSFGRYTSTCLYSWNGSVTHNDDGTAWVGADVGFNTGISEGTIYASKGLTLTTIPRASQPSVSGNTMGSPITINTNRKSGSFTHTLKYNFNGHQAVIAENVGDSHKWTPPLSTFASWCTDATSKSCTIICNTYQNGSLVGTKETSFNLNVPSSVVPKINSVTLSDGSKQYAKFGAYVKSRSEIKAVVNASGIYGSSIKKYTSKLESDAKNTATSSIIVGVPSVAGNRPVYFTVADTRDRTAAKTETIKVADWNLPNVSIDAVRWNTATSKEDDESTTVRITLTAKNIVDVNGKGLNYILGSLYYGGDPSTSLDPGYTVTGLVPGSGGGTGGEIRDFDEINPDITVDGTTRLGDFTIVGASGTTKIVTITGVPSDKQHDFKIKYWDIAMSLDGAESDKLTADAHVGTATPIMDIRSNGKGVAFLGVSTGDGILMGADTSLQGTATFQKPATFQGTATFQKPATFQDVLDSTSHIYMSNDKALCGKTTSGSNVSLLRMNGSNQVEFNWTTGGLRGRPRKTLWSGQTQPGSTLTIPEQMYYNLFLMEQGDSRLGNGFLIGYRVNVGGRGSYIACIGIGYDNDEHATTIARMQSTSDTTWKFLYSSIATIGRINEQYIWQDLMITKIEGVL